MELLFEIRNQKNIQTLKKKSNIHNIMKHKISKINSSPNTNFLKNQQLNLNYFRKRKSDDLINSIKEEMIFDKSFQLMNINKIKNEASSCIDLNKIKKKQKNSKNRIKYPIKNQYYDIRFNSSKIMNIEKIMKIESNDIKNIVPGKKLFPFYYYFMDVFLDFIKQPKKFCIVSQQYLTAYNFMSQLYDISTYVLLYEQFNIIRRVLYFKYYGYFNMTKKINILDEKIMVSINENLKNKKSAIFSDKLLIQCPNN